MKTKHYFKLAFSSHHAENITFLIDCNREPWRLFHRNAHRHWKEIHCDGEALKHYLREAARPGTWQKESHPFLKKHQTYYQMDYTSIDAAWNFGKGVVYRTYRLDSYDEGLLVGVREARGLMRFLDGFEIKVENM